MLLMEPQDRQFAFQRKGNLNELCLAGNLADYKGQCLFEGQEEAAPDVDAKLQPSCGCSPASTDPMLGSTSKWVLDSAGKPGGWMSGGMLSGIYTKAGTPRKAFIKRDNCVEAQIAEVLASTCINTVFPTAATEVELVTPKMDDAREKTHWQDVYAASYFNLHFRHILCDVPEVKSAYGCPGCRGFEPLMYITPLVRGGRALENAYPEGCGPEFLLSLQKALIANLVIANNDMHLGNLLVCGEDGSPKYIQAFDFGAAFNFSNSPRDQRVAYDANYRGAIITESVNHFKNFPESWTVDSETFWRQVAEMGAFSSEHVHSTFDYLKMYYEEHVLLSFLQNRIFVGQRLDTSASLQACIDEFALLLQQRVDSFKQEAIQQLALLQQIPFHIRVQRRRRLYFIKLILCILILLGIVYFATKYLFKVALP